MQRENNESLKCHLNRKSHEVLVLNAVIVPILDRLFKQIFVREREDGNIILEDRAAARALQDVVDDVVAERVEVCLDAQIGRRQETRIAALNNQAAVVNNANEGLRGSDLKLGADKVLPVADPEHDSSE